MWIEATDKPLRIQFKQGDEVRLEPGRPVQFAEDEGRKLLARGKGKVRLWINPEADWLNLWRLVAEISAGLETTDARLPRVMQAIASCDRAFVAGSKAAFLVGVNAVVKGMEHTS